MDSGFGIVGDRGVCAQEPPPAAKVAVKAGHLLDVKSGRYLENQVILIEGARIQKVGAAAEVQISSDVKVVDLPPGPCFPA